ncbi:MAG: hypothetical protein V4689_09605 [Verrucomicrobiota bacterium]
MIRSIKILFIIPAAGMLLTLGACEPSASKLPPPPIVTDTAPVGDGLKVIGFAVLGAAVVCVLGRMVR